MKSSKSAQKFAKRVMHLCQSAGVLDEEKLSKALDFLSANPPNDYRSILFALRKMVRLELEKKSAYIQSAQALGTLEKRRISEALSQRKTGNLVFHYSTNPELIGGLHIRIGSQVYDGSIRSKIHRLANAL